MRKFKINVLVEEEWKKFKGEVLLLPIFEDEKEKDSLFKKINQLARNNLLKKADRIRFKGKRGEMFVAPFSVGMSEEVLVFGLGKRKEFSLSSFQTTFADVLRRVVSLKISSVALSADERFGKDGFKIGRLFCEALYLSQYQFNKYKSEEEKRKIGKIEELNLYLQKTQSSPQFVRELEKGVEFGRIVSEGIYLARDLVNEPASHVHPETLVQEAFKIEKESKGKIKVEVLDEDECRRLGMRAFLAVAQGSERKPKFITLHYRAIDSVTSFPPASAREKLRAVGSPSTRATYRGESNIKTICLIGKSITFDSGGLSLKPAEAMETMKIDMAGGAVVLGVFKILLKLIETTEVPFEAYGILPACENMPSGRALRPGDVVSALNGRTIEVVNTDAEGRLVLADALSYAEKYIKPDYIIDLATLTGAIMGALGEEITGLFGNDAGFVEKLKKAGEEENEELWEMPLYEPYLEKMKSGVADLKNVSGTRYGGAITGALFLKEFVKTAKWIHLDIAGSSYNAGEPKGIIPKGGTGWGVRTILSFLISCSRV